jgi:hypothetical protein
MNDHGRERRPRDGPLRRAGVCEEALPQGDGHGLEAGVGTELTDEVSQMGAHRQPVAQIRSWISRAARSPDSTAPSIQAC